VLRSSKLLADSTWSGVDYTSNYDTSQEVQGALDEAGVDYVVIDPSAPSTPHGEVLRKTIEHGDNFTPIAVQSLSGRVRSGTIAIYKRRVPATPRKTALSVALGPERGHRVLSCR
jgi:hypothetical protein